MALCDRRLVLTAVMLTFAASASLAGHEPSPGASISLPEIQGFPSQPIRLIVYTSPGGLIDVTARRFARLAQEHAGHPFAVINRPGGGGIVAFEEAVREPADGHRLLAVTRSNISKLVATGREDLIDRTHWHAAIMDNPHVLITNTAEGPGDWAALHAVGREAGREQLWLGVDIGGVKHVSGVKIAEKAGVRMRWIPYGSGGEAVAALLGNLGTAYLGNPRDALASDKLGIVAVAAPQRLPEFPDAPTFAELGIDGLEDELIWRGFALRRDVPEDILEWYSALIQMVLNDPRWISAWQGEGVNLRLLDSEHFSALVERDRAEFQAYLARLGLLPAERRQGGLLTRLAEPPGLAAVAAVAALVLVGLAMGLRASRRRRESGEVVLSAAIAVMAVLALLMTVTLPPPNPVDPVGSTGIPRLWLGLALALAVWQTARRMRAQRARPGASDMSRLPAALALFVGYLLVLPVLGYIAATLLTMPALTRLLGYRRWPVIAAITAGWLAFTVLVFQRLLLVDLPRGVWFG